jgi:hypothetical protein
MTYDPISQNNDDHFYTAACAYVRGEPNNVVPGTVGEEQAEIAKRLLQENPAILDDKDRLLSEIATIHYRESGIEAHEAWWAEREKKHDDDLFADLVAYVRDQPHEIVSGTNGEIWAKHAKQLAAEDPIILDDQKRLLAAVRGWSPPEEADLESPGRWRVHNGSVTVADEFHGHKDVHLNWFVLWREAPPDLPYAELIEGYDTAALEDAYGGGPEACLQEHFTEDEANALADYLEACGHGRPDITPAELPLAMNCMPVSAIPVGGPQEFLMLHKRESYTLPFKVEGYYDLRHYDFIEEDK